MQKKMHNLLANLGIFMDLSPYKPILCGTIPLDISTASSDLDIIMDVRNFNQFKQTVDNLYSHFPHYHFQLKTVRGTLTAKANFFVQDKEIELFGQPHPVETQFAYLHMCIEYEILKQRPVLKEKVIQYKESGMKTEPAFASLLGLKGDPYEALIQYGREQIGIGCFS
ncbi:DUF4269 domain-containing protein [Bacillus sp. JCM 19041]|uniref:DUF4269 domain-containing protein n=1 Tax=Bacillus sp. JCM 19041 TaxID=1460637 RepID=UPI00336AEA4D